MSGAPSPVPPGAGDAAAGDDWRSSVPQSARNADVWEIAGVLAALENDPGVTARSKLRLATQFEDAVFNHATSLADYRKKLAKRLKKAQKLYVPPSASPAGFGTDAARLAAIRQLRSKYGETILYILKHADAAVANMKLKHGAEKAAQLRQHTDSVRSWANDLGLALPSSSQPGSSSSSGGSRATTAPTSTSMSDADIQRLQGLLEKAVENIRSHVIKLADPDGFLGETLAKTESAPENGGISNRGSRLLALTCRRRYGKRYEQLSSSSRSSAPASSSSSSSAAAAASIDPVLMIQQALQTIDRPVPLPTRNDGTSAINPPRAAAGGNTYYDTRAALIHLDKLLASSSVLLGWAMTPNKDELPLARNLLTKAHSAAREGADVVATVVAEMRRSSGDASRKGVSLEDAWKKPLVLPAPSIEALDAAPPGSASATAPAKPTRPVVRSRVLFTPGRKPPSSVINALGRKRAVLVRPPPRGEGTHVVLEFGTAFTMTVYLVPLLVTFRAQKRSQTDPRPTTSDVDGYGEGCATMKPLCYGFEDENYQGSGDGGRGSGSLQVWGVRGPVEILGRVVEERLRDAGAHATAVLRGCFAASRSMDAASSDFEVEVLEATALLEFLQAARTTYEPDWQDDDV